jgi:hypothetical protein
MTALALHRGLADSLAELFDTIDAEPIAALLAEYRDRRATLTRVASLFTDADTSVALPYFIEGNKANDRYSGTAVAEQLFKLPGAVKALDADYWNRALRVTDVLECMPAARRKEWHDQIEKHDVPEFTESALRTTLAEHLAARPRYFAERVDGLFRALSPEHVTNLPTGFRSKLILNYVFDGDGYASSGRIDTLTDLRVIVARFMGRTDIGEGSNAVRCLTRQLVNYARQQKRGEWVSVDGNAIEIKCHKSGTCHVRMHEELAWRLNAVLAYLHPHAIPESARTRPKRGSVKQPKTVELVTRPLPFAVLRVLDDLLQYSLRNHTHDVARGVWHHDHGWRNVDKHVRAEVDAVTESLGGGLVARNGVDLDSGAYHFDYDATEVLRELIASGVVPDQRAHQFYPTPKWLAERVVELAEIGPDDRVLEPSAGQGALADLIPRGATRDEGAQLVCVEASALHCAILRAKGHRVIAGDFLDASLADEHGGLLAGYHVDRVVMNPPFDRGQWVRHVEHAAGMLDGRGARLVAVLPSGAPSKLSLPGFTLTWSESIAGAFCGTNVSVVLLTAVKHL